jgi:SP family arabinose:H+ symporter-like MFS transporter
VFAAFFLGISLYLWTGTYSPVFALFMYIGSHSLGLSTLAFIVPTEVFPMKYRGKCFGLAWFIDRITAAFVAFNYPALAHLITPSGVFCMYSGIALCGLIFVYKKLPEVFFF